MVKLQTVYRKNRCRIRQTVNLLFTNAEIKDKVHVRIHTL